MASKYIHWNSNGFLHTKQNEKIDLVESFLQNPGIIKCFSLCDVRFRSKDDIPEKLQQYQHLYHIILNEVEQDKCSGNLLFINKTEDVLEIKKIIPGRLLFCEIVNKCSGISRSMFSLYIKSNCTQNEFKNYLDKMREEIILNDRQNLTFLGDFNFVTSSLDRNSNNIEADGKYINLWEEFTSQFDLIDTFRITNPRRRQYTFSTPNEKSKSRIDRIYMSRMNTGLVHSNVFQNTLLSDHKVVILNFKSEVEMGPEYYVFNNDLLKDSLFVDEMKKEIKESDELLTKLGSQRDIWDVFKNIIINKARTYAMQKSMITKNLLYTLRKDIYFLEILPKSSINHNVTKTLKKLKLIESEILKGKVRGMLLRAKVPHIEERDPDISIASRLEKLHGQNNVISCLVDKNGVLQEGTDKVIDIVDEY